MVWVWGDNTSGQLGQPAGIVAEPRLLDFDAVPPDQGNVLRALRQG